MKFIPLLLSLFLFSCAQLSRESCPSTVAAFDIGSGTTKVMVAKHDACQGRVLEVLHTDSKRVSYARDLAGQFQMGQRGFSAAIMDQGTQSMAEMMNTVMSFEPNKIFGVATQAFRQAANSHQLLDLWREQWGLEASIITQDLEAILAYRLIESKVPRRYRERLVVWDMGGGSQQITWRAFRSQHFSFFHSEIASVTFQTKALEHLNRKTPNPITTEEVKGLSDLVYIWAKPLIPHELLEFIKEGANIYALGGVHGASLLNQMGLSEGDWITYQKLSETLERQLGKTDEEIGGRFASTDVTNLVLIKSLMELYGIDKTRGYRVTSADLTEAIILFHDEYIAPAVYSGF